MRDDDTIFALSSGDPPAGVAVVRVSGPGVRFGLETLIGSIPERRRASLRSIRADGATIDEGLVLFFPGPGSFTGEDMAELHVHGGRAVVAALLGALERLEGFRAAEAGEFTRRAFFHRRLDLTEVEGLADLVAAETEAQRRQAMLQAKGALRQRCEDWRERLVRVRGLIEAELDFPDEEDVPKGAAGAVWGEVGAVTGEIGRLLDDGGRGERIRDGAEIVVLGPPNSGKSTLINALARRDVAIVSSEPGTTRDLIEVRLDVAGYPVTVVDTAGIHEAGGLVEREGMRRATDRARGADLVLWLSEAGARLPYAGETRALCIGTKIDLIAADEERGRRAREFDLVLSARSGEGVTELLQRIGEFLKGQVAPGESSLISRARQRAALSACRDALLAAVREDHALELRAEDLRHATDALGRLAGRVDVEDVLDVIFREFCIGK
jgi:tRNA modification GTPase